MFRYTLCLFFLVWIAVANDSAAQSVAVFGVWEATIERSGHIDHHVLRLEETGSYEYTILSNDPDIPLRSDSGSYELIDDKIALSSEQGVQLLADSLRVSADRASLVHGTLFIEFGPGREFNGKIYGTWAFLGSDGQWTGSTFTAFQDGTFEADVSTGHEKGWFVIAGSAMVHFPTEASNSRLLGIPGLWTHLKVSSNVLSYTIPNIGIVVTATRVRPTSIASASWADVKSSVFGVHNGR